MRNNTPDTPEMVYNFLQNGIQSFNPQDNTVSSQILNPAQGSGYTISDGTTVNPHLYFNKNNTQGNDIPSISAAPSGMQQTPLFAGDQPLPIMGNQNPLAANFQTPTIGNFQVQDIKNNQIPTIGNYQLQNVMNNQTPAMKNNPAENILNQQKSGAGNQQNLTAGNYQTNINNFQPQNFMNTQKPTIANYQTQDVKNNQALTIKNFQPQRKRFYAPTPAVKKAPVYDDLSALPKSPTEEYIYHNVYEDDEPVVKIAKVIQNTILSTPEVLDGYTPEQLYAMTHLFKPDGSIDEEELSVFDPRPAKYAEIDAMDTSDDMKAFLKDIAFPKTIDGAIRKFNRDLEEIRQRNKAVSKANWIDKISKERAEKLKNSTVTENSQNNGVKTGLAANMPEENNQIADPLQTDPLQQLQNLPTAGMPEDNTKQPEAGQKPAEDEPTEVTLKGGISNDATAIYDKDGNIHYVDKYGNEYKSNDKLNLLKRAAKSIYGFLHEHLAPVKSKDIAQSETGFLAGLLTAPFGLGVNTTKAIAAKLAPAVGSKIAQYIADGISSGFIGGSAEGALRGVEEDKNPAKSALHDGIISAASGGALGAGAGNIEKQFAKKTLKNLEENLKSKSYRSAVNKYFSDYERGVFTNNKDIGQIILPSEAMKETNIQNIHKSSSVINLSKSLRNADYVKQEEAQHTHKYPIKNFIRLRGKNNDYLIARNEKNGKQYFYKTTDSGEPGPKPAAQSPNNIIHYLDKKYKSNKENLLKSIILGSKIPSFLRKISKQ